VANTEPTDFLPPVKRWQTRARGEAVALARAGCDDAEVAAALRHRFVDTATESVAKSPARTSKRARQIDEYMAQWAQMLSDARTEGATAVQERLHELATQGDGPEAVRAALHLAKERISVSEMEREVLKWLRQLRHKSPDELAAVLEQTKEQVRSAP